MRKNNIFFRADGNKDSGLGHLYRIFALIEMYKETYNCILLTKENSTLAVIPPSYSFKTIPSSLTIDDEPNWLNENYSLENNWLIADGYHFTSEWQKKVKALKARLMYIDDFCSNHMYADVVVNHSLGISPSRYSVESYTKLALGTFYAILRPMFLEVAKTERVISSIETAFICFGGADSLNLTLKATRAALNIAAIKNIHIVIGAAYQYKEIFEMATEHSCIHIHQNISEASLIEVMKSCDIAIAPSSNILYEICAVKMPVLSGYYVENQKNIYNGSVQKEIIFDGGNLESYKEVDFERALNKLISEKNYQRYINAQSKLFDQHIKNRFLNLINDVNYRKAKQQDVLLVFNWANDQLSRANSYFSEPIALETHQAWFEKKLKDTNCSIYIALVDGKPAGMVRYEVAEESAVVGILVGEDFRGLGMATRFLNDTAGLYFEEHSKPVLAYIKIENTASVKSFEKAGYKKMKSQVMHGHDSFVYKLENYDV